jgi:cobalt-precorrin 5A hydrolase
MGVTTVEMWGSQHGLTVENFTDLPAVNGAIVNGGKLAVISQWDIPENQRNIGQIDKTDYFDQEDVLFGSSYDAYVYLTDKAQGSGYRDQEDKPCLILRPKSLVVGVGMRRGTSQETLKKVVEETFANAGLSLKALKCFASVDIKSDELGLLQLAESLQVPCYFYNQETLQKLVEDNNLLTSAFVKSQIGVGAVCEPAALAVVEKSKLIVKKVKDQGVTVAVARVPFIW